MKTGYSRQLLAPVAAAVMLLVFVLLARSSGPALCPRVVLTPDRPAVTGFDLADASRYPSHVCVRSAEGLKMFSHAPFEFDLTGFRGKMLTLSVEAKSLGASRTLPVFRITCPNGFTRMITVENEEFSRYAIDLGYVSSRCKLIIEYVNDGPSDKGGMDLEIKGVAVEEVGK